MLSDFKAFSGMYEGTQTFITQMTKMVGTEPLESSNGDNTLLTTYMVSICIQYDIHCIQSTVEYYVDCTELLSVTHLSWFDFKRR